MDKRIEVNVKNQVLLAMQGSKEVFCFNISTARKGVGQQFGSEQTPLGRHCVRAKIGAKAPLNAVFKARRMTGEIYSSALEQAHPERDWILTRIMWLSGCELGFNRLGSVDTMRRYVYIHGCPDQRFVLDTPFTHGCIGMRSEDIIALFDWSAFGTSVLIE
jgi:L,D-transpeptidase YbiS